MDSVVRQFQKLMEERDGTVLRDAKSKRVEVIGLVKSYEGKPMFTVLPYGKSQGVYQTPAIHPEEEDD